MIKKILIVLGAVIILSLSVLFSFTDKTVSYFDTASTSENRIGNLIKDHEVRMDFKADQNNLKSISLKIGTYGLTTLTTMDVQVIDENENMVMQKSVNLKDVTDNKYYTIAMDRYVESRGKTFTVIITSPDAENDNAISLYTNQPKGSTTHLFYDGVEQESVLTFRATYVNNFDVETLVVLLYFIAVIFCFILFIYKFL